MSADDENDGMDGYENIDNIAEFKFRIDDSKNGDADQSWKDFQEPDAVIFGVDKWPEQEGSYDKK